MLATDAQWNYIRVLMNEAFRNLYKQTPNIDVHHRPTFYTKEQASGDIKKLLNAKKNGWK